MRAKLDKRMKAVGAAAAAIVVFGSCLVAAAGAGAGGAFHFSGNGVESILTTSIEDALTASERAFQHFRITRTEFKEEDGGARRQLKGKTLDEETDVTVTLVRQTDTSTRVEVTARKSLVTWDKDFAREVAEKIVELAG